ncbi:hypothetical protein [Aliiruegeria sabulilitoris]|uniref:hypothetical protein n=1 Tax=Aliiruegeria sabulilitoris TaxID=1510458 RepID=UPI00082AB568|nr:hypothetical protein [Aliiruegeria sabulilitoris]
MSGLLRAFAKSPRGRVEARAGAVGHLDLVFPWQPVAAGGEVGDVGIGAVLRAAFHGDIAAMAEQVIKALSE